jgi:hypothetical protein
MPVKKSASSLATENKQFVESPAGQDGFISEIPKNLIDLFDYTDNTNQSDRFYIVLLKRYISKIRTGIDEMLRMKNSAGELGPFRSETQKLNNLSAHLFKNYFKGTENYKGKALDLVDSYKQKGAYQSMLIEGMPVALIDRRYSRLQYLNIGGLYLDNIGIVYLFDGCKNPIDTEDIKSTLRHEFIHMSNKILGIKEKIKKSESNNIKATLLYSFVDEFLAYRSNDRNGKWISTPEDIENWYFYKDQHKRNASNSKLSEDSRKYSTDLYNQNTLDISKIWLKIIQKLRTDETGVMANKLKSYLLMNVETLDDLVLSIPANKTKFEAATGLHLGEDIYEPKKDEVLPSPISH